MLTALRKHTQSFVVKILAGLLIASFAVWGVGDMFAPRFSGSAIIEVGDMEVETYEVENAIRREINRLRPLLGNTFDFDQAKKLGVMDSVLQRKINDTALLVAADKLGVTVSDDLVSRDIRDNPVFRGLGGGFDRERLNRFLFDSNMTEGTFINEIRHFLARDQLIQSLSGVAAPQVLVDSLYRYREERRTVETIEITDASQPEPAEPDAATIEKYHKENAVHFTAPELRALTVVRLDADELAREVSVSDEEIRAAYDNRANEYTTLASRKVEQIIVADEDTAKKALKALSEDRAFGDVAKEIAGMDPTATDLGRMTRDQMLPELADAVFALADGTISAPVKSPLGWHVFRVSEIETGGTRTLDQVRDELKETLAHERAVDGMFELANKLEDILAGGATPAEAAADLGLRINKIPAIDANGRDADGKPIENLPEGPFLRVAFDTDEAADSSLHETGPDGYFVLRVDKVTPPVLRPLETVKAGVIAAWKRERRAEAAKAQAEAVTERLKGGTAIAAIAKERGVEVKKSAPFTRRPKAGTVDLPGPLVETVFQVNPGEAAMARADAGYVVARLAEILPVDPTLDLDGVRALSARIKESIEQDLMIQFAGALRNKFGVSINRQAVDGMFSGRTVRR